ncbi:MAG: hypothetical protein K6E30_02090 [Lachnospiraceae bacterium]|nr:hypothetical protein [Lachnospiraceae bacterium]
MVYILQIAFIIILLTRWNAGNNCYKILVLLQMLSFAFAPLVSNRVIFNSFLTYFNVIFSLLNIYLITRPWKYSGFHSITIENEDFYSFYKKVLYAVLLFTIINNLIVFLCVKIYMPDIALLKAQQGYKKLYDAIPFFGISYRYTAISRNFGFLALPLCVYYINRRLYKEVAKAFILSLSSLFGALGTYSRAQLLTYAMIVICFYFYVKELFHAEINAFIMKMLKYLFVFIVVIFAAVTISRFSSATMNYYGDRIPKDSYITDPVLYSVFEYASSGFTNGVNQLELHESSDILYGEPIVYDLMLMASYFRLTSWNAEDYKVRVMNSYNKEGLNPGNGWSSFHGYTCRMVKAVGYFFTLLTSIIYYKYVRIKSSKKTISIKSLSILIFLLLVSINSIYYMDYSAALFPLLFYIILYFMYSVCSSMSRVINQVSCCKSSSQDVVSACDEH